MMKKNIVSLFLAAVMTLTFIYAVPTTTANAAIGYSDGFNAGNTVNLLQPTALVFKEKKQNSFTNHTFKDIQFQNVTAGPALSQVLYSKDGVIFDNTNGKLTIPAAMFGQHNSPRALTAGTYRAYITLEDSSGSIEIHTAEFGVLSYTDTEQDAFFSFVGDYSNLKEVLLNRTVLGRPTIDNNSAHLNGYGGYGLNLGLVKRGSVEVTLFKEFLRTLASGTYTLEVTFTDGTSGSLFFVIPSKAEPTTTYAVYDDYSEPEPEQVVRSMWLERSDAQRLAALAKLQNKDNTRTIRSETYGVRGNAWDRLEGLLYYHDSRADGKIQVRIYFSDPMKMKKDTLVSAYVADEYVKTTKTRFNKHFKNEIRVISFDQKADWDNPVTVAAKLDLTGMNTKNLYFYAYDKKANTYRRIARPDYRIDANGFLHFTTPYAGDIIVSDGPLELR